MWITNHAKQRFKERVTGKDRPDYLTDAKIRRMMNNAAEVEPLDGKGETDAKYFQSSGYILVVKYGAVLTIMPIDWQKWKRVIK